MTETTKTVFEKYKVRKTKAQKSEFIEYVKDFAGGEGYEVRIEKGALGARNIVVGNLDCASVVFTAHYDTCPRMILPNFITPKNFSIYILYQLVITFLLIILPAAVVSFGTGFTLSFLGVAPTISQAIASILGELVLILMIFLLFIGPANKNTANDNTSGVTTLLDIMVDLPLEFREDTAFVFFDLEEVGLFGSAGFASKHKKAMKEKLLLNFDCVSDGSNIIFVLRRGAKKNENVIQDAFVNTENINREVLSKGVFYPSDQVNFPCGVGVAALKKSKRGILYMNRIHTSKDTIYKEENIEYLKDGAISLVKALSQK